MHLSDDELGINYIMLWKEIRFGVRNYEIWVWIIAYSLCVILDESFELSQSHL